jgi:uncharacterized protein YmfQ (DUF2313 family)
MARDYARLLRQLLPKGAIWDTLGENLEDVLDGLAVELARVDTRADELELEMMPGTSTELLPVWEAALGMPDEGCALAATTAERQAAAQARFVARGRDYGAGAIFLTKVAAELGYTLEITRWRRAPFLAGESLVGVDDVDDERAYFVWEFHVSHVSADLDAELLCALKRTAINDFTLSIPLAPLTTFTYTRASGATHTDIITGAVSTLGEDEPGYSWVGV